MSRFWLPIVALALTLCTTAARAQDDGARVYQLQPVGAQVLTAFGVVKRGNEGPDPGEVFGGTHTATNTAVFRWAGTFGLWGRQLNPFVILPTGRVSSTPVGAASQTSGGLGDVQIGAVFGLFGEPALSRAQYASYRPAISIGLLNRIYFPTGAYSRSQPVNFGANRFTYQVGVPTTLFLSGASYLDPRLTTLELLPTLNFYAPNDAPFQAGRATRELLFSLEGHLTHNFSRRVWVSADMLYREGGGTTTDGVANHDAQSGLSAGASLVFPFAGRTNLSLTYEHVVARNDNGPIGWFFRAALLAPF